MSRARWGLALTAFLYCLSVQAMPITNTVTVEGKEWAQPIYFVDLSWSDINARCGSGSCTGTLNGFDVDGWMWADVDAVNELFNSYLQAALVSGDSLLQGPDSFYQSGSMWAPAFHLKFTPTNFNETTQLTWGWLSAQPDVGLGSLAFIDDPALTALLDGANSANADDISRTEPILGAWLYRDEGPSQVPIPSTLILMGLGLVSLRFARGRAG